MTESTSTPFPPTGQVRKQAWPVTVGEALEVADAAGFRTTPRSGPDRAHVQRDWRTAATIRPVPGGVVVKPAWTTTQLAVVAAVLALFVFGVCVI
jgi:hypothetical protein